ncbi:MAG: hypothetical protein K0R08_586 [Solimicrobium sp.]|nr:hypothetical protein [Solimicrobium sp.]
MPTSKVTAVFLIALLFTACSPQFDWRDVQGVESPYTVLMPGKPSRLSREIQLEQRTVAMHLTAVQVNDVKFAVGAIKMSDANQARAAVMLIKNALLKNIKGIITREKTTVATRNGELIVNDEFSAVSTHSSVRLSGRLVAYRDWTFEVLVVEPKYKINPDADETVVDTFLSSFKPM